jgi:hypothetical protein
LAYMPRLLKPLARISFEPAAALLGARVAGCAAWTAGEVLYEGPW